MNFCFEDEYLKILKNAGWQENRIIDIRFLKDLYLQSDRSYFDCSEEFLRSFYGIRLYLPDYSEIYDRYHVDFKIDVYLDKSNYNTNSTVKFAQDRLNQKLMLIGVTVFDFYILMNKSGRFFGFGFPDVVYDLGFDGKHVIEVLINDNWFLENRL